MCALAHVCVCACVWPTLGTAPQDAICFGFKTRPLNGLELAGRLSLLGADPQGSSVLALAAGVHQHTWIFSVYSGESSAH